jgi:hypothetical protein
MRHGRIAGLALQRAHFVVRKRLAKTFSNPARRNAKATLLVSMGAR